MLFEQIATVIAPIFIVTGIGYLWVVRGMSFDNETISNLVMMVGTPCLVFSTLTSIDIDLKTFGQVVLASVSIIGSCIVLGWVLLKLTRLPVNTYLPALIHPNTGNMGLPLVLLAFGEPGLALGISYFFVNSVSQYTLGMGISSGSFHPLQLLKQPIIWAVLLVFIVRGAELTVPVWIASTTEILGGLVIPAMLLMLGTALARLHLVDFRQNMVIALSRLGFGLATGLFAIWAFDLSGTIAGVVFLQAAMPVAVFNFIFAERFNRNPEKVAAVILLSTLISFATLPLLVGIALRLASHG
ncbi:MAG: AEC family transporter [Gammaproteobacteria bacterium]|nr:AEC family transporter [Gammaproteobacteria bacterium]